DRLLAVLDDVELVQHLRALQAFRGQARVGGIVLDQKNDDRFESLLRHVRSSSVRDVAAARGASAIVKWKVVPAPGIESTQMRPPWFSTMRLQTASPMPVPGYFPRAWSR